jgi:hypothetical protein
MTKFIAVTAISTTNDVVQHITTILNVSRIIAITPGKDVGSSILFEGDDIMAVTESLKDMAKILSDL